MGGTQVVWRELLIGGTPEQIGSCNVLQILALISERRGCLLPSAEDLSPSDASAFVMRAERTPAMQVQRRFES